MQFEQITQRLGIEYDAAGEKAATAGQERIAEGVKKVGDETEKTQKRQGLLGSAIGYAQQNQKAAFTAASVATAAVGSALASAGEQARAYETVVAQIATLGPEAAAGTAHWKDEIISVSAAMGQDAVVAANAMYDALSSGVPPNNALAFMEQAGKTAVAGATDSGTAVKALTATLNAWKLGAEEASNVSDTFFTGVNLGVFSFEDLGSSIGQVAPLAASLGVTYQEVTAATATLTKSGLTASQAITQQRAAMTALITPNKEMSGVLERLAADNDEVRAVMEEQGLSAGEAALKHLGLQGALLATREAAEAEGVVMAKAAGSVEALGAILGLTGENAAGAAADLDAMNSSAGATDAAFDTMAQTAEMKLAVMRETVKGWAIQIGSFLGPIGGAVLEVGQAAAGLAPMVQTMHNLVGPAFSAAGGLSGLAGGAKSALLALAPLGLTLGVVAAAVGVLYLAVQRGNEALDEQYEAARKSGGSFDDYTAAVMKAQQESGLLAAAGVRLKQSQQELSDNFTQANQGYALAGEALGLLWDKMTGGGAAADEASEATRNYNAQLEEARNLAAATSGDIIMAGQAWLDNSTNMSAAAMNSDAYRLAMANLNDELQAGNLSSGEYQAKLQEVAGAAMMATEGTTLLTNAQVALVAETEKSLTLYAQTQGVLGPGAIASEDFAAGVAKIAEAQALQNMTADEARAAVDELAASYATSAATATEAASSYTQYSDVLMQGVGGAAMGFDPEAMAQMDEDQLKERNKKIEDAYNEFMTATQSHFVDMLTARGEFNTQHAALVDQGKMDEANKLQAAYDTEVANQQAHLAQLALNHLNAMLQINNISEEQAQLIYGSLAEAFPDSELFTPANAAMLDFSATFGQAMAGNKEAALELPDVIKAVPDSLDAAADVADDYKARSIAVAQETRAAYEGLAGGVAQTTGEMNTSAEAGAAAVEQAGERKRTAYQLESAELGIASDDIMADYAATGQAAGKFATDVQSEGQKAAAGAAAGGAGIKAGLANAAGEFDNVGSRAGAAASTVTGQFAGVGTSVEGAAKRGVSALGELDAKQKAVADTSRVLGSEAASGFGQGADAASDAAGGVTSATDEMQGGMSDASETALQLGDDIAALPPETTLQLNVLGIQEARKEFQGLLADLVRFEAAARKGVVIPVTAKPTSPHTEQGGSFAMEHWLYDLQDAASDGVLINLYVNDTSGGLLLASGGEMLWQTYLRELVGTDYPVIVTPTLDESVILAQIEAARIEADRLLGVLTAQHDVFMKGADNEYGSLGWIIQNWGLIGQPFNFAEFAQMLNVPVSTMEEFRAHFDALDPEGKADLWKRMYDDLREMEKQRHEQHEANLKAELDADFQGRGGLEQQIADIKAELKSYEGQEDKGNETERAKARLAILEIEMDRRKRVLDEAMAAEDARHDSVMAGLEAENKLVTRQYEDWRDQIKATEALEKERAEAQKAFIKAVRDEQKATEEVEKDAHRLALKMLEDLKDAEEDRHKARLRALDDQKAAEDELHKDRLAKLDALLDGERSHLDGLEDQMALLKISMSELKLDTASLQQAKDELEAQKSLLDKLKSALDSIRKQHARRVTPTGQIGLDEQAREALEAALASGKLSEAEERRARRLLAGQKLGFSQHQALLERAIELQEEGIKKQGKAVDVAQDAITAKQREIDQLQILIDKEKFRYDHAAEAIRQQIEDEKTRHADALKAIADKKEAEDDAWTAYMTRLDAAKRAEDERHDAKMRQIEAEFRARLIAEGLLEEAGGDPEEALRRAQAIADKIFGALRDLVGTSEPAPPITITVPVQGGERGGQAKRPGLPTPPGQPPPSPFSLPINAPPDVNPNRRSWGSLPPPGPTGGGQGVAIINYGTINYADPLLEPAREGVGQAGGAFSRKGRRGP